MTVTFEPLVPWTWIAGAAVALLLAELLPLWTRGRRVVSRGRAAAISLLGLLAGLVALAVLAQPTVTEESRGRVRATVLVDASRSMATADEPGRATRYEAALEAARGLASACPGARIDIEAFSGPGPSTGEVPETPRGEATAIGDALARTTARANGDREPLAAIALVSDGAQGTGRDPVVAAREALAAGVRVFTIATGTREARPGARLGRASLVAPERAPAGSTATVRARIELEGLEGVPVDLELRLDGKVVGQTTVEGSGPRAWREAAFEVALGGEGIRALALRAAAGDRMSQGAARVRVLSGRARVALVDAPGRWEHRYLHRALEDSPRLALDRIDVWGAAGPHSNATPATLAAIGSADVIVLGDLPAHALAPDVGREIARAVEEGAGLLVLAGKRGFEAARELGLGPLLPVDISGDAVPIGDPVRPAVTDAGRVLLASGLALPEGDLAAALDRMPPLPSYVPLPPALREATVLLEAPSHRPLLVLGRHGLGRTALLASDTTWRWAFPRHEAREGPSPARVHDALLRELTLALAPRDAGLRAPAELEVGPGRVHPGDAIPLGVRIHDPALASRSIDLALEDPLSGATLAEARVAGAARASLELPRGYGGGAVLARAVARDAAGVEVARDERIVEVAGVEAQEQPGEPADPALLARIADAGGGAGFAREDVARGAARVAFVGALEARRPVERRSGPLAAGPAYAFLLALLLGASWALRRGGGLA